MGDSLSYLDDLLILQHTESRSSFACDHNIKEDIFTELEVLLCR